MKALTLFSTRMREYSRWLTLLQSETRIGFAWRNFGMMNSFDSFDGISRADALPRGVRQLLAEAFNDYVHRALPHRRL